MISELDLTVIDYVYVWRGAMATQKLLPRSAANSFLCPEGLFYFMSQLDWNYLKCSTTWQWQFEILIEMC